MSRQDRKCNYCNKRVEEGSYFDYGYWDVIACDIKCDTALSWLLDGVSIAEVEKAFPVKGE